MVWCISGSEYKAGDVLLALDALHVVDQLHLLAISLDLFSFLVMVGTRTDVHFFMSQVGTGLESDCLF